MSLVFKVFVTRRSLVGHVGDSNTGMSRHICISSSVVSGLLKKKVRHGFFLELGQLYAVSRWRD